ncbi:MAG: hypothetical protein KKH94_01595 [Candidatus Omnitrophica bacterium]|nr:hypothetical protein [Candidatus Omnitrophota bacterium]
MDKDILIGIIVVISGLGFIIWLVIWSSRTIDRIAKRGHPSLREILKDL